MIKIKTLSFEGVTIYCGIDVHKKNWRVNIRTFDRELEDFSQNADVDCFITHVKKRYPGALVKVAYEAGFCGFCACRKMMLAGIDCIVINAADVPSSDKDKKQKNDTVDARKIARELSKDNLRAIYVPTLKQQNDRSLVRVREQMVENQTRCKNQIRHLMHFSGLKVQDGVDKERYWTNAFIKALQELDCGDESLRMTLDMMLKELTEIRKRVLESTRLVRKLAQTGAYSKNVELIRSIPGIGQVNAMVILTELGDIHRFANFDHLCSYAGLTPSTEDSGDRKKDRGITHRCNNRLRTALIESSWMIISKDPAMLMMYSQYCRNMNKNQAIIRIGKHLLSRIKYVLIKQERYETCVV
jgi:transposase